MFNTTTIKNKRATISVEPNVVNNPRSKKPFLKKQKPNVLDFAGIWNELSDKELKTLDSVMLNRRTSHRRNGL